jgi:hypothetical protein
MSNPIELNTTIPDQPSQIQELATAIINVEQLQSLIGLLDTDPATLVLPSGRNFSEVRNFNIKVFPNGAVVRAVF